MKQSWVKKSATFLLLFTFLLPEALLAQPLIMDVPRISVPPSQSQPPAFLEPGLELKALEASLQKGATYLEYTKYMMLRNKQELETGKKFSGYIPYNIRPNGMSPLSREYGGVPLNTSGVSYNAGLGNSIDLVTGGRAIDESLQLGSIGSGQAQIMMTPQQRNAQAQLNQAIRIYYSENQEYPDRLDQLDLTKNLGTHNAGLAEDFAYSKVGNSFKLTFVGIPTAPIPVEEVEGLTIEHHPWQEMIGDANPPIPDIYNLIPDDYFFIHFNDLERYRELEQTLNSIKGPLTEAYGIGDALSTQNRIFDRLGIIDDPDLDVFLDEVALVSYDFDGYPATDYALIIKPKTSMLNDFVTKHINAPANHKGESGEYYVVATSEQLFKHIQATASGKVDSMAESLDLKYSLSVLEEERDGFAFISDAFVEKITSPEYRINARRRNTILTALETLQYSSFAYKDITGTWPRSVSEMIDTKYLKPNSVYESEKYSIDEKGIVSHQDWGSIYNVTPIAQVQIKTVLPSEKVLYDRFREGYQQFWREFIDPVAVSILIGDQIRFHTIILPLIDESDYNWIRDIVGDENEPLDFVTNPDRAPAVQFTSHIDIESALYGVYKSSPRSFDVAYQDCVEEWYKKRRENPNMVQSTYYEECSTSELSEANGSQAVKETIAKEIDWDGESAKMFDFLGDEFTLAAGENATFMIEDLSNFDVHFGIELTDPVEAQKFIEHVFGWAFGEMYGGESVSMGLFGVTPGKPIKNAYNGVEFYMIPTGFINLFYIFINDRIYFTISQTAINELIDSKGGSWSGYMQRLQDYLSPGHGVSLLMDGQKMNKWIKGFAKEQLFSYAAYSNFASMQNYFKEISLFEQGVMDGIGNSSNQFYSFTPDEWFGLPVEVIGGQAHIKTADGVVKMDDVSMRNRYFYNGDDEENPNSVEFKDVMEHVDIDSLIKSWTEIDSFGADLSVTKEGLDIHVAFNNQARDEYDSRVAEREPGTSGPDEETLLLVSLAALLILLSAGAVLFFLHRKKQIAPTPAQNSFQPSNTAEPIDLHGVQPGAQPTAPSTPTQPAPISKEENPQVGYGEQSQDQGDIGKS